MNMTGMGKVRMDYLGKMSGNFAKIMVSSLLLFCQDLLMGLLRNIDEIKSVKSFSLLVSLFGIAGIVVYGGKLYRSTKQYLRCKNVINYMDVTTLSKCKNLIS